MNQLLNSGEKVQMLPTELSYEVEKFLGGGGQGEVYRAKLVDGQGAGLLVALKWFFPHYLRQDLGPARTAGARGRQRPPLATAFSGRRS